MKATIDKSIWQPHANKPAFFWCLLLLSALLAGCGTFTPREIPHATERPPQQNDPAEITDLTEKNLSQLFDRQFQAWRGTPYRLGGLSKNGIDCSGFVYITFRNVLGIEIPRSTEYQSELGTPVSLQQLNVGDLVFFKTGLFKQHVGIYVGNQHFIHASTSRGVMKSKLNSPYWSRHYWKSKRILSY